MSNKDILQFIFSKSLRGFLREHPIKLSIMQKATIVSEYAPTKKKIRIFNELVNESDDLFEKQLLVSALQDIKHYFDIGQNTNQLYYDYVVSKRGGYPAYPFLEICNLPILFKKGDIIYDEDRNVCFVAGLPNLNVGTCDFSDECYLCYSLNCKNPMDNDALFEAHKHIPVAVADGFPLDKLLRKQQANLKALKQVMNID